MQQVPNSEAEHSLPLRSQSIALGQNHGASQINHGLELFRRVRSANDGHVGGIMAISSLVNTEGFSTPQNRIGTDLSSDESDRLSRMSPSALSICSDSSAVEPTLTPNLISESSENVVELTLSHVIKEDHHHSSSPPSVLVYNYSFLI